MHSGLRRQLPQDQLQRRQGLHPARKWRVARAQQLGRAKRGFPEQRRLGHRRGRRAHGVFLAVLLRPLGVVFRELRLRLGILRGHDRVLHRPIRLPPRREDGRELLRYAGKLGQCLHRERRHGAAHAGLHHVSTQHHGELPGLPARRRGGQPHGRRTREACLLSHRRLRIWRLPSRDACRRRLGGHARRAALRRGHDPALRRRRQVVPGRGR